MELLSISHFDLFKLFVLIIWVWVIVVVLIPLSFLTTFLFSLLKTLALHFFNFREIVISLFIILKSMLFNMIIRRDYWRAVTILAYAVSLVLHHPHNVLIVSGARHPLRNDRVSPRSWLLARLIEPSRCRKPVERRNVLAMVASLHLLMLPYHSLCHLRLIWLPIRALITYRALIPLWRQSQVIIIGRYHLIFVPRSNLKATTRV